MLKIGAYLRTQRERKGLSHEQIHETTRISPDILRKIEEGRPLLAPIFLKGFIKNYAKALGLDPAPLLKELEEREKDSQNSGELKSEEPSEQPPPSSPSHWNQKKGLYISLGAGLTVLLVFLAVFPRFSKIEGGSEEANQTEFQDADQTTFTPQPETEESERLPPPSPTTSLLDTIHQGQFTQEVMINPSSRPLEVYFKADGGDMAARSLPPKQWYVIKALKKIYLRIDRPASLSMIHNGEWRESVSPLEQTFE